MPRAEIFGAAGRSAARRAASPPRHPRSSRACSPRAGGRATSSRADRGRPSRSAAARSPRAVRANGPAVIEARRERDRGRSASRSPYVGFNPQMPDSDAGWRIDPPVSVPVLPRARAARRRPPPSRRSCRRERTRRSTDSSPDRRTTFRSTSPSRTRPCSSCRPARCRALPRPVDDVRVVRRDEVLEHPRAARRAQPCGHQDVLVRDRHAR